MGASFTLGGVASGRAAASNDDSVVQLGEFSDGRDGWKTTFRNDLERISDEEMPSTVQVGSHALGVEIDGGRHPRIINKKRVKKADFTEHPYLMAHVMGYAAETESDLVFTFRLYHTALSTDAHAQTHSDSDTKSVDELEEQYDLDDVDHSETDASIQTSSRGVLPVEESTEKTVSQLTPTRL